MKVGVVGLGKLGLPMAALFASKGHEVIGFDQSEERVSEVNDGADPIGEPGLFDLLSSCWSGALDATTDFSRVAETDIVFIVVPTPSGPDGRFSNKFVRAALTGIAPYLKDRWRTIVITSTVMPGTMDGTVVPWLESYDLKVGTDVGLAYSPEFIALGSVLHDLENPDFVLVGMDGDPTMRSFGDLRSVMDPVVGPLWITHHGYRTSFINAEIAKLALNAYLGLKVSYANTLAELCETIPGADARRVTEIVGQDRRIGGAFLTPGGPASGPCLPRDLVALSQVCDWEGLRRIPEAVKEVNDRQPFRIAALLSGQSVAILGMSYKTGTRVTDESLGVKVKEILDRFNVAVETADPFSNRSPQEVINAAESVLVALPIDTYRHLDYGDKVVVDVWGILRDNPTGKVFEVGVGWRE